MIDRDIIILSLYSFGYLDVGSGDGKYFGVNPNIVSIGCDR